MTNSLHSRCLKVDLKTMTQFCQSPKKEVPPLLDPTILFSRVELSDGCHGLGLAWIGFLRWAAQARLGLKQQAKTRDMLVGLAPEPVYLD